MGRRRENTATVPPDEWFSAELFRHLNSPVLPSCFGENFTDYVKRVKIAMVLRPKLASYTNEPSEVITTVEALISVSLANS